LVEIEGEDGFEKRPTRLPYHALDPRGGHTLGDEERDVTLDGWVLRKGGVTRPLGRGHRGREGELQRPDSLRPGGGVDELLVHLPAPSDHGAGRVDGPVREGGHVECVIDSARLDGT